MRFGKTFAKFPVGILKTQATDLTLIIIVPLSFARQVTTALPVQMGGYGLPIFDLGIYTTVEGRWIFWSGLGAGDINKKFRSPGDQLGINHAASRTNGQVVDAKVTPFATVFFQYNHAKIISAQTLF